MLQQHVSYEFIPGYIGHVTIFSSMFTIACCLVLGLELGLGLALDFSVQLLSCYAHAFMCVHNNLTTTFRL